MDMKGTTIIAVKRDGKIAMAGDGQVTLGEKIIFKGNARKVRRLYEGKVVVGFAGSTADAFNLCEKFESMLNKYSGSLLRASVELAKSWRGETAARNLEAMMLVADKENLLIVTGNGDVIEPDDGVCAIGSGGSYALSAGKALIRNTEMSAIEIARKSMEIASELCVFTNTNFTLEEV